MHRSIGFMGRGSGTGDEVNAWIGAFVYTFSSSVGWRSFLPLPSINIPRV